MERKILSFYSRVICICPRLTVMVCLELLFSLLLRHYKHVNAIKCISVWIMVESLWSSGCPYWELKGIILAGSTHILDIRLRKANSPGRVSGLAHPFTAWTCRPGSPTSSSVQLLPPVWRARHWRVTHCQVWDGWCRESGCDTHLFYYLQTS